MPRPPEIYDEQYGDHDEKKKYGQAKNKKPIYIRIEKIEKKEEYGNRYDIDQADDNRMLSYIIQAIRNNTEKNKG
jgi:hypothetical protein